MHKEAETSLAVRVESKPRFQDSPGCVSVGRDGRLSRVIGVVELLRELAEDVSADGR
jgi:hypothetical protein